MTGRRRRSLRAWLAAAAAALAGCAWAQEPAPQPEYRIGPGDMIRVLVFQNPELTLETRVSENGVISYPLIGAVKLGGLTVAASEKRIAAALQSGGFIKDPQVNIVPVQIRSHQVSVLGHVGRPGRFPLETVSTRLSEVIAMAGGIAPDGADVVIVSGARSGQPFRREIDLLVLFRENAPQNDIVIAGGDVIYVPRAPIFYIYGEAQRPGSYRVERGMTMRQALAQGGGPTPRGSERNLSVIRPNAAGRLGTLAPDLDELVQPNDVLRVGQSLF